VQLVIANETSILNMQVRLLATLPYYPRIIII
jgi:hypothetical protein